MLFVQLNVEGIFHSFKSAAWLQETSVLQDAETLTLACAAAPARSPPNNQRPTPNQTEPVALSLSHASPTRNNFLL